jgi:Reverse transcriptase (RNA-dependent DNA polymerase)/RNase H-like domain found in reverse transcriptase
MLIDFIDLNKACPMDPFPLQKIDQLVDSISGHAFLYFMDAFSGYNQIKMCKEDEDKTTFITNLGIYCYKVMSFGLRNAGVTFERIVNKVFEKQISHNLEAYVDDILVKSMTEDSHLADLAEAFETMNKVNMKMNPKKSYFGLARGNFLDFMVSIRGIEIHPSSLKSILDMQPPKNLKELQSLTGKLADPPCLTRPAIGDSLLLYLVVAEHVVSAALVREEGTQQQPVYFISHVLQDAETKYSPMEKIAYALVIAARKLRSYFQTHLIRVLTGILSRKH